MCKLCAFVARYPRVRQDLLVFDLRQFAVAVEATLSEQLTEQLSEQLSEQLTEQLTEPPQDRSPTNIQEKTP